MGEAEALMKIAKAKADSVKLMSEALRENKGDQSASLFLAQQYVEEFGNLAKTNNTVIMPADVSNVNSMVVQALSIYKNLNKANEQPVLEENSSENSTKPVKEYT